MEYKFQIMLNKGTNLWEFIDENGFVYGTDSLDEVAEKLEEMADIYPIKDLMVVQVLNPQVSIQLPDPCPVPDKPNTPPDKPNEPETPPTEPGNTNDTDTL